MVFVDGRHRPELSIPGTGGSGIQVRNLADACAKNDPLLQQHLARHARCDENAFVALNTSMLGDGAAIVVERGAQISQPVFLLFVSTGRQSGVDARPLQDGIIAALAPARTSCRTAAQPVNT